MKAKFILLFLLLAVCSITKAQPPETTYLGNVVYEGYYDDRSWGPFNIGFNFTFYGNTYSQFYVTSNGLVMFGSGSSDYTEDPIPSSASPNNLIAAFWDDIVIDPSGKILYTTIGAAPNRKCIIQWTNMGFYASTVLMGTFQAILYEGSNNIQVQYRSIIDNTSDRSHGSSAVIGLENSSGSAGVQYAYHNSSAISSEQAILFSPSGSTYTMNSSATYDGVYLTKNMTLPEPGIPSLISPAMNGVIGASHTFEWSAASNATSYTLKISSNSDISGSTDYNAGTNLTYNVTGLTLNSTYYWAVFANNSTGTTWSEIFRFSTSTNPPLTAIPQTYYMEQGEERSIRLQYTGGDASAKTAYITSLPAQGALYQYNAGARGSQITSVPAAVSDANMNVIYVASGGSGNGAGNFNFYIHDNTGNSATQTNTINVNPPGIPNFLLAAKSGNIEIQFDKPMNDPTGKESQFTVKVNGTPVTISSVSLKPGDPYTIVVTLAVPLTGTETVLISYTQGNVSAESGGLLPSFVDQPVFFLIQTISFPALPTMTYGDAPITLSATASSGLPVTFVSSNTSVGSISGTTLTANSPGTANITAQQVGNGTYAPAKYIRVLTVNKANQTITFPALAAKTYGDADFSGGATSSSGLPVSYSSDNTAVATIVGSNIHITGAGTAIITASQEGSSLYNAANNVTATLTVGKANQTITFNAIPAKLVSDADFTPVASSTSSLTITFTSSNPAVATIVGNAVHMVAAGTTTITASQAGNSNYNAATPVNQTLTVNKGSQTITFAALAAKTYGDPDFSPGATASSGLSVTYTSSNPAVATISGGMIHITGAGTSVITASQAGDANFNAAPDVQQTLTVNKAAQTITFGAITARTFGDPDFDPLATSSSGLTVTYTSSNTSVATVTGNMIHIVGAGSTQITASQTGNTNYLAAADVQQTLLVQKASQTITFPALPDGTYGGSDITPAATASSGLAVTYTSSDPSVATIVAGVVHITGAGTVTITASQAGNTNFNAAPDVQHTITISKANQTITFGALAPKVFGSADFNPGATASSGLGVTYSSSNTAVAVISGNMIQINGAGTAVITASQAGNSNYNAAPDIQQTLVVTKSDQSITFDPLPAFTYGDLPFNPGAVASSGLDVTYTSSDPTVATVVGNVITILKAGTSMITASQAGDDNFNAATDVTQPLTVNKASQTITFNVFGVHVYGDANFSPGASSSSTLAVEYSSSNTAVAVISGNMIQVVGAGTADITASQPGNENYLAATDVTRTLTIGKASQSITFGLIPAKAFGDPDFDPLATASSGLTVTYSSSNTSVATVSGSTIHIAGAGSSVITASQAGDANYLAAPDVSQTLSVSKASQTITFPALPEGTYGGSDITPAAVASSGLVVSYSSSNTSVAVIDAGVIKIMGAGSAIITASQTGDGNYDPAPEQHQTLVVNKADQTITFGAIIPVVFGDPDLSPGATASSGLPVTYASSNTAVVTIVGNMIHIIGAGSAVITASQAGNANFNAATDAEQTLIVNKAGQTITFAALPEYTYGDDPFSPGATATSGLTVTYSSSDPAIASVIGGFITIHKAGSVVITASQAGNDNYSSAVDVTQTLTIKKAIQTITFNPLDPKVYGNPTFDPGATSSAGLVVTYSSSNTAIAKIEGNMIRIAGAGTVDITALQDGDSNYEAATPVIQSLVIAKADQTINFPNLNGVVYGAASFSPGATASSGYAITYTSDNASVATISGGLIQIKGAGTAIITASQPGNGNYNAATSVWDTLVVSKATLTVTADDKSKAFLSQNPTLTFTYSGFAYSDDETVIDVAPTVATTAVQGSAVGEYPITVSGAADNSYNFVYVDGTMTVTRIPQTVTITTAPESILVNETFDLQATASSGLAVQFESGNAEIATITGNTVKGVSRGTVVIRAFHPGDDNYLPAEASVTIEVISTHKNILNLFTPNNDGFNDYWEVLNLEELGKCDVRVYNRWGKLVFSSKDYHNEWDGTSNGQPLPDAAYYYIIKTEKAGTLTGTVNIVR